MIEAWLVSWQAMPLPGAYAVAVTLHAAIYLAWGSVVSVTYGLLRDKLRTGRVLDERAFFPSQVKSELGRGVLICGVIATVTVPCVRLADSALPASPAAFAGELLGLMVVYEVAFYALHRLLHTRPFQHVHGIHHRSVRTTPWSGLSVHPVEAVFIEAPILLFALLAPVSVATLVAFQVVLHYFSAGGHGNYDPFDRLAGFGWLKSYMRMHQLHHARGVVNYSTFTPLMDRFLGTHQP